ncbi:MAG: hypothetical protein SFY67_17255 [Candidatus Melainabacteria bacterium]|nr:hypothetical protein [Candidatus Melainabacteria bacterium]
MQISIKSISMVTGAALILVLLSQINFTSYSQFPSELVPFAQFGVDLSIWVIFSVVLVSFIEHQIHSQLMHRRNWLSKRKKSFQRIYEAHALDHHQHYSKEFCDDPVPPGEDKEIRLNVHKAPIKMFPIALVIGIFSIPCAITFLVVATIHHWIWNKIHLEMHKPEDRAYKHWPIYKFLARHHYLHHQYQNKNFNVVFPFADYVLGTNAHATEIDTAKMKALGY